MRAGEAALPSRDDESAWLSGEAEPPQRRVRWRAAVRIIPSRFPPVDLFERIADPADFEALYAVESLTNARLRDEVGDIELVPREDRVFGPGSSYIMASFTHLNPGGGRFNPSTFGAFYAARDRGTAVAETVYHRERFLSATREPAIELDMRVLEARFDAKLHDLRGAALPRIRASEDYSAGQSLASRLRAQRSAGVVYESVRRAGGQCVAILRPRVISECRQAEHLVYAWDGTRIAAVYEKRRYTP